MFTRPQYPVTHISVPLHQSSIISALTHRPTCSFKGLGWKSAEWPLPTNGISLSVVWESSVTSNRWLALFRLVIHFPAFSFFFPPLPFFHPDRLGRLNSEPVVCWYAGACPAFLRSGWPTWRITDSGIKTWECINIEILSLCFLTMNLKYQVE